MTHAWTIEPGNECCQVLPVMIDLLEDIQQEFADRYDGAPDARMQWMGELMRRIEEVLRQANG
jgi:hypothetical protein